MKRNAIVVLTRGYSDLHQYCRLIERNQSIEMRFFSRLSPGQRAATDVIIFHEGNIAIEHQAFLQAQTPRLPLTFQAVPFFSLSVASKATLAGNLDLSLLCPSTPLSEAFSIGYKNMCFFWSVRFYEYLKEYGNVIRIDEDCVIHRIPLDIFDRYNERIVYGSPTYQKGDSPEVVVGMHEFFRIQIAKNTVQVSLPERTSDLRCPYTNVFIMYMPHFVNSPVIQNVVNDLRECGCVFRNRWGDLPIHGYILNCFVPLEMWIEEKEIAYYHGSHKTEVNMQED